MASRSSLRQSTSFASDEDARDAFPVLDDVVIEGLQDGGTRPQLASAPQVGDQIVAYAGELPSEESESSFQVGIVLWQERDAVFLVVGGGLTGDILAEIFDVARKMSGRQRGDDPIATPTSDHEMHTGGVWDQLPVLADVPEGFVFLSEREILLNTDERPAP